MGEGDVVVGVPMILPASHDQQPDRSLAALGHWCVQNRRPVQLPVILVGRFVRFDD